MSSRVNPNFDGGLPGDVFEWEGNHDCHYLVQIDHKAPQGVMWRTVNLTVGVPDEIFMNSRDRFNGWRKVT